jgi:hypothetical protein
MYVKSVGGQEGNCVLRHVAGQHRAADEDGGDRHRRRKAARGASSGWQWCEVGSGIGQMAQRASGSARRGGWVDGSSAAAAAQRRRRWREPGVGARIPRRSAVQAVCFDRDKLADRVGHRQSGACPAVCANVVTVQARKGRSAVRGEIAAAACPWPGRVCPIQPQACAAAGRPRRAIYKQERGGCAGGSGLRAAPRGRRRVKCLQRGALQEGAGGATLGQQRSTARGLMQAPFVSGSIVPTVALASRRAWRRRHPPVVCHQEWVTAAVGSTTATMDAAGSAHWARRALRRGGPHRRCKQAAACGAHLCCCGCCGRSLRLGVGL